MKFKQKEVTKYGFGKRSFLCYEFDKKPLFSLESPSKNAFLSSSGGIEPHFPMAVFIARLACSIDSVCVNFFGFTRPAGRPYQCLQGQKISF